MSAVIDTRGLSCPQPVLLVLERIRHDAPAELDILTDNDASRENITRAAQNRGYSVEIPPETTPDAVRLHLKKV